MNVFVYGTLMFPEVARPVAGITSWGEPVTLHGFRRYRVQLDRSRGHFPAIVPDDAGQVHGLLFRNITEEQMQRLDEFEEVADGSYVRQVGSIETDSGACDACVYVASGPLLPRLNGPWDAQHFRDQELDWYTDNVVDRFVENLRQKASNVR